jgi:hypothetical protein
VDQREELFENRLHTFRANVTMRAGINVIGQAKSSQKSHAQVRADAPQRFGARSGTDSADPNSESSRGKPATVSPHKAGYAAKIGPSELHSWPRAERRATCYARPQETVADFVFGVVIPLH